MEIKVKMTCGCGCWSILYLKLEKVMCPINVVFVMLVNGSLKRPWNVARNVFVHMCRLIRVK